MESREKEQGGDERREKCGREEWERQEKGDHGETRDWSGREKDRGEKVNGRQK